MLYASSANICCGEHAGSWQLTQATIGLALDHGIRIGMHPGYPNRADMGRKSLQEHEIGKASDSLMRQIEQFFNFVPAAYLKPHGAFYGDSQDPVHPAFAILNSALTRYALPLMGLPGTAHENAPYGFIREGFVDRAYDSAGCLVPRSHPSAVHQSPDVIGKQAVQLAPLVDSLCLHGDTENCVEIAAFVVKVLLENGYEVGAP